MFCAGLVNSNNKMEKARQLERQENKVVEFDELEPRSEECLEFIRKVSEMEKSIEGDENEREHKELKNKETNSKTESTHTDTQNKFNVLLESLKQEVDKNLKDLPEVLEEALQKAQTIKDQLLSEYTTKLIGLSGEPSMICDTPQKEEEIKLQDQEQFQAPEQLATGQQRLSEQLQRRRLSSLKFLELEKEWSQHQGIGEQQPKQSNLIPKEQAQIQRNQEDLSNLQSRQQKVEAEINQCLFVKVAEKFSILSSIEDEIQNWCFERFNESFDKEMLQQIIGESQHTEAPDRHPSKEKQVITIDSYICNFWETLEAKFGQEVLEQQISKVVRDCEPQSLLEFFVSHIKLQVMELLQALIGKFQQSFMTYHEESWNQFIQDELAKARHQEDPHAYVVPGLNIKALQTAFAIMVKLPIRKDVKHDLDLLETKVLKAWTRFKFNSKIQFYWDGTSSHIEAMANELFSLLKSQNNLKQTVQNMFGLLFTILNAFVATSHYDGADRHFIKLFLENCVPVFQRLLEVNHDVSLHFLLQLFECHVTDRIPQDVFDLRKLVYAFTNPQQILEELKITQSMPRCVHLELVRVSKPEVKSKHVIICISGFLQEKEDKADTWKNVAKYYKHAEVYALSWTACNAGDFFNKGVYDPDKTSSYKSVLNFTNLFSTAQRQYIFAYDQARLSGSLLAVFLLKSKFFKGRAVSLIGFSLGTVATMHCMRILKGKYKQGFVRASKILSEAQLWAGAYVIDPKQLLQERMRTAFHLSVVNGRVSNLYSFADSVLTYAQPVMHKEANTVAIGIQEILTDVPEDMDGKIGCKKVWNLDVTKEAGNHGGYRDGCVKFLPMIPWAY